MTGTSTTVRAAAQPTCEDCEVALRPVGRGEHRYWSCGYCGSTVPLG